MTFIYMFTVIGRTDAEAKMPILWSPHVKNWLTGKDPYAGKDWRQEEKGTTEDEMVGWHHRLDGLEFEWTPRVGDGQEGLVCCSPWGCQELDTTEETELNWTVIFRASQVVLVLKDPPANAGDARDVGSIPGSERSSGGGNGNPFQYSCLDNPMDRGTWWDTVHGVAKNQTRLTQLSTHGHI